MLPPKWRQAESDISVDGCIYSHAASSSMKEPLFRVRFQAHTKWKQQAIIICKRGINDEQFIPEI